VPMPAFPRPVGKPNWSAEIEAILSYLDNSMIAEIAARAAADSTEQTARQNADTAEATARANADTTEANTRLANDNAEQAARIAADTSVVGAYKNVIRNGDMSIAQRGDGPFAAGGYCIDGLSKAHTGGAASLTRFPIQAGNPGGRFYVSNVVSGQSAAGDYSILNFFIENGQMLLGGKQVTLSFLAGMGSGTSKIGVELTSAFGTGGSPTTTFQTSIGAIPILVGSGVSALGKYSVTFTVPTNAGKTFGTNNNDLLQITLWLSAGTSFNARASSIGIQNVGTNITDVQLEAGSVVTAFERLPIAAQLAWCQRYFWRWTMGNTQTMCIGMCWSASSPYWVVKYPVPMRTIPSVVMPAPSAVTNYGNTVAAALTVLVFNPSTNEQAEFSGTSPGAGIAGGGALIRASSGATATFDFSAEL